MERGLVLRQHFFGSDSEEVWCACKIVGEMCNLLAMTYLQQEDFGMVLELLKKAEILTERDEAGRAVTYNNLACYYRRRGKLHAALQYLQKALKIEAKMVGNKRCAVFCCTPDVVCRGPRRYQFSEYTVYCYVAKTASCRRRLCVRHRIHMCNCNTVIDLVHYRFN